MLQLGGQGDCAGCAFAAAVREAEHPEGEGGGRKRRDTWVVAETEPARPVMLRREGGDRLVEVGEAAV